MDIQVSTLDDVQGWLDLAREVEPLFGPMADEPSFQQGLRDIILANQAFCLREQNGKPGTTLCGGIIISKADNEIVWFAVAHSCQGQGLGKSLLQHALSHLQTDQEISVTTFDGTVPKGLPARRLYQRFGFQDAHKGVVNPAGIPTVVMIRPEDHT